MTIDKLTTDRQIAPISEEHTLAAAEVLASAFFDDPLCLYT
jgi:hypothetical protein